MPAMDSHDKYVYDTNIDDRPCKVYIRGTSFAIEWKYGEEFVAADTYWSAVSKARERITSERQRVRVSVPFCHVEGRKVRRATAVGSRQHGVAYKNDDGDEAGTVETCGFDGGAALAPLSAAEVAECEALLAEEAALADRMRAFHKAHAVDLAALVEAEVEKKIAAKIARERAVNEANAAARERVAAGAGKAVQS